MIKKHLKQNKQGDQHRKIKASKMQLTVGTNEGKARQNSSERRDDNIGGNIATVLMIRNT
jgi:hypothetical protein